MKILIIGAGPGGYETALEARKKGFEVTLIEGRQVGGTCLNAGCIPTKAYCRSAEILEEVRRAPDFGIRAGIPEPDFLQIRARKDSIVANLRSNVEAQLEAAGVALVRGFAVFRDDRTVTADGKDHTADYIIIATGSAPSMPPIPGIGLPGVLDSAALLETDRIPSRLCIIGGGVIGLEFASVFRSFGSEVTVLESCREILPRYDQEIARRLRQSLFRRGIVFSLSSSVESVGRSGDGLTVAWERKGARESVAADNVLVAAGRRPCSGGLKLEAAGISSESSAILTDEDMRTSVPHIFAIGDVNGRCQLAHAAVSQGKLAIEAIVRSLNPSGCRAGEKTRPDLSIMPSAVFTLPEAASVGLTEEECRTKSLPYRVCKSFFRANGKAVCMGETEGLCKLIVSEKDRILGAHILGPHASDLIHEISVLMSAGAPLQVLGNSIHIHPALGEVFRNF